MQPLFLICAFVAVQQSVCSRLCYVEQSLSSFPVIVFICIIAVLYTAF